MSNRAGPPFRADHVGSLIRPRALLEAREQYAAGRIDQEALIAVQHEAVRDVVRLQEDLGLRSVTDGEYNRESWQTDFVLKIANVETHESRFTTSFHNEQGAEQRRPATVRVVGKVSRPAPMFVEDFAFLKATTHETAKITLPSPSVVHFRGGREAVDAAAYPDINDFYADLARVYAEEIAGLGAAGCRYVQLDEVNLAYLCDPNLRRQVQANLGEDPDQLPHTYARLINAAIAGRPAGMTVCMHLCRGNFGGRWMAEGGYEPVAETLFNEFEVDGYFMEYDSPRAGSFEPLKYLPKGKTVVLGLVTTKKGVLETKDELKRRIDEAARFAPLEQLALSPQCGFSSRLGADTMDIEHEKQKLALVVETAREVWGEA